MLPSLPVASLIACSEAGMGGLESRSVSGGAVTALPVPAVLTWQWGMYGRMEHRIAQNHPQEKWRALCEAQKPKAVQDISVSISLNKEMLPLQIAHHLQLLLPRPAQDISPLSPIVEEHIKCLQVTEKGWNEAR